MFLLQIRKPVRRSKGPNTSTRGESKTVADQVGILHNGNHGQPHLILARSTAKNTLYLAKIKCGRSLTTLDFSEIKRCQRPHFTQFFQKAETTAGQGRDSDTLEK
jgi:hypothetical protein